MELLGVFFLVLWVLPGIIASKRNHRNALAITMCAVVLGWTGIGWLVALVWACTDNVNKLCVNIQKQN